jgi:PAS domain S-box-containing protein
MSAGEGREILLDGALWNLVRATAITSGEQFFRVLTPKLADALGMQFATVSEISEQHGHGRTLSRWTGTDWEENVDYDLSQMPCGHVVETRELLCCAHGVRERFPQDSRLLVLGIESYLGAPLLASSGEVIGHLCVMDKEPLKDEARAKTILETFASRTAAELHRIRTERELESQGSFLRQVLDINPSLIFVKDRQGRFTLVNRSLAEVYGTTVEGLLGKTDADFNPNREEVEFFRKMDLEVMDTLQERFIAEEPLTEADEQVHWVQTIKRPIVDPDGTADQVLGVATDITELKRTREELLQRERREHEKAQAELDKVKEELVRQTRLAAIGQVAASIAHELRNPLGAINNAVFYLSRREAGLGPKWLEYLGIIRQEVQASDRIVSTLLEMSRAKDPSKKPVDLGAAAAEAFRRVRGTRSVELRVALSPDPFVIDADPEQLRQVFNNLMTNAVQSMEDGGKIEIEGRREEETDVVTLRDDGRGIPPEDRDRIFEPLFTTKAKGTGLGLAICRQILQRHGASIDLLPAERGAAFEIRFPRS